MPKTPELSISVSVCRKLYWILCRYRGATYYDYLDLDMLSFSSVEDVLTAIKALMQFSDLPDLATLRIRHPPQILHKNFPNILIQYSHPGSWRVNTVDPRLNIFLTTEITDAITFCSNYLAMPDVGLANEAL